MSAPHVVGGYGTCRHCDYEGPVKVDGTLRKHKATTWGQPCRGAGQPPRAAGTGWRDYESEA